MDPQNPLKIAVLGAGAIGAYVGGMLASRGADVVLVGRDRLKREIAEHGLTLINLAGESRVLEKERVRVETDPASLGDRDVVLVCTKSGDTLESAKSVASVLSKECLVISLQNGVRNAETLRDALSQTVLAGIVGFNVVWKSDGVFKQATSGPLAIEASEHPHAAELTERLKNAGFQLETPRDIRKKQWTKLVINLNNAVGALADVSTKDLILSAGYRRVLAATIEEALRVLATAKIDLARLGPLPVSFFPPLLRLPTPLFRFLARAQLSVDPEARSSMWQDLDRRRKTEVDFLNGEIVRLAESQGEDAPRNRRIVALIREAEKKNAGSPKMSASDLWTAVTP